MSVKVSSLPVASAVANTDHVVGNAAGTTSRMSVGAEPGLATFAQAVGGANAADELLAAWCEAGAYEATAITLDSDQVVTTATVVWPDGSAGTFTTTTKDTTWLAVDAYTVTHVDSGKTVTQAAVTRDANGNVTTKPALTVA